MRAQLLDGTATGVEETVRRLGFLQLDPISVVAPAAAPRPLEPARELVRPGRARPAALGGAEARRVERVPLPGGGPAAPASAHAPARPRARPAAHRVPEGERVVPPVRAAGARAPGAAALARDRGPRADGPRGAPLVGRAEDGADARRAERARRGRRRRPARQAAALGPRRALVPRDGDGAAGRRRSDCCSSAAGARSASGSRRGGCTSTRRPTTGPCRARTTLLSPFDRLDPRPRPRGGALGLPLPDRDLRADGEARVRLLRAADPPRRPADRPDRPGPRPQGRRAARERGLCGAGRSARRLAGGPRSPRRPGSLDRRRGGRAPRLPRPWTRTHRPWHGLRDARDPRGAGAGSRPPAPSRCRSTRPRPTSRTRSASTRATTTRASPTRRGRALQACLASLESADARHRLLLRARRDDDAHAPRQPRRARRLP